MRHRLPATLLLAGLLLGAAERACADPQRLVEALSSDELRRGRHRLNFAAPATSGRWLLLVDRGRPALLQRLELA